MTNNLAPSLNDYAAFAQIAQQMRDNVFGQVGSTVIPAGSTLVDRADAPGETTYHGYAFQNVATGAPVAFIEINARHGIGGRRH